MNAPQISTRLLLAKAFQCPPADIVPVDEFEDPEAARKRRIEVQKKRQARKLSYPDLENTVGF